MARQMVRTGRGREGRPSPDPAERYERWERDFFAAQQELAAVTEEATAAAELQREALVRQREVSRRCVALLKKFPGVENAPSKAPVVGELLSDKEAAQMLGLSRVYLRKGRMNGFFAEGVTPPPFIRLGRMIRYRRDDLERWIEERKGGYK